MALLLIMIMFCYVMLKRNSYFLLIIWDLIIELN